MYQGARLASLLWCILELQRISLKFLVEHLYQYFQWQNIKRLYRANNYVKDADPDQKNSTCILTSCMHRRNYSGPKNWRYCFKVPEKWLERTCKLSTMYTCQVQVRRRRSDNGNLESHVQCSHNCRLI